MLKARAPFSWILIPAWLWIMPAAFADADRGPLQVQNRFPLHLMFLSPRPIPALASSQGVLEGSLAFDYSSIYVNQSNAQWRVLMDMELAVVELSFAYGLSHRAALRLDVPVVNMGGGFLDGFLEAYHDLLGVGNYGRENRPKNSFAYRIDNEAAWLEADSGGMRLADVTLSGQWTLSFSPGSSLLARLKLPTGESDHGYGSGRWDAGLFIPTEFEWGPWSVYAMPGIMWHSDPKTQGAAVDARTSYGLFIGASYRYSRKWEWLAHLNYFSSPIEKTGIETLDDGAFELALGFRRILSSGWHIELALGEDLFTRAAPDFTVHLGVVRTFYRKHACKSVYSEGRSVQ